MRGELCEGGRRRRRVEEEHARLEAQALQLDPAAAEAAVEAAAHPTLAAQLADAVSEVAPRTAGQGA